MEHDKISVQDIVFTYFIYIIGWSLIGIFVGSMAWYNNIKKFDR